VYGLFAFVLGGNLVSFAFNRQVWPFSPYPMFAEARGLTFTTYPLALFVRVAGSRQCRS
jgi:hypothetical protein